MSPTAVVKSLGIWEGCGCYSTLLVMGSLLLVPFYSSSTLHMMEVSASAKSEVIEHDQHGWVEVEEHS